MKANKIYTVKPVQYINVQSASTSSVTAEYEIKEDDMGKGRINGGMQSLTANDHLPSQHHFNSVEATNNGSNLTGATRDQECQTMATEMAIDHEKPNLEKVEKSHFHSEPTLQSHGGSRSLLTLIRRRQQRRFRAPQKSTAVKYLQYFLSFLYFIGISPIPPASGARKLPKWIARLQMAVFWLLALTSVLQGLDELKFGWIQFRVDENMLNFITLGFYFANLLTRIYCIKLFVTSAKSTSCLMETIQDINGAENFSNASSKRIAIGIGTLSLVLAVVSTIFGYTYLNQWSLKTATLDRARELHESIYTWTSENYTQEMSYLYELYNTNTNLTIKIELFAAAGNFLTFCGTMHACVLLDIWLIVSIQIYILQLNFTNTLIKTKASDRTGKCPLSIHWKYYKRLRAVCEQSDLVFGKLLKMVHMQNLLLFGYFLFQLLKKEPVSAIFLTDMFSVLKVSITYYLVQKSTEKNEMYEQCVIDCSKCGNIIEMDGEDMNVVVLLKDMKRHPIGIGRGDFYVNETFVLKFTGAVGSIFMLLSGEIDQNKCSCASA